MPLTSEIMADTGILYVPSLLSVTQVRQVPSDILEGFPDMVRLVLAVFPSADASIITSSATLEPRLPAVNTAKAWPG